ncbi:MAG TPA: hypothetical protein P5523_03770 [Bacteroidales bacterium]|nr:hypothetical protein [Bacteroidales bacterium]
MIETLISFIELFNIHPEAILCEPVSIIGGIVAGVSAIGKAAGAVAEGNAARNAGEFNAQIAMNNAQLSRQQAAEDERVFRVSARKEIGGIRSGYAAGGITSEGNAQDVLEESAANAELDALKIKHGGEVRAKGFEADAALSKAKGEAAQTSAAFSAAGSLLEAAPKAYSGISSGKLGLKRT